MATNDKSCFPFEIPKKVWILAGISVAFLIIAAIIYALISPGDKTKGGLSPPVQELCDSYWSWRMKDMPEFATFVGIHDYDDHMDDISEEAQVQRFEKCKDFLKEAVAIEAPLTEEDDILNIRVLKSELQTFIDGFPLKGYYLPLTFMGGIQTDMLDELGWMLRESKLDYEKMIARLSQLPIRVDQIIDVMTKGMNAGIASHQIAMKHMNESLGEYVVDNSTKSPFYKFFESEFPDSLSKEEIDTLQTTAKSIITEKVSPAYEKLRKFVESDYVTRKDIAVTSMSNGPEFYKALIRFHTSTNKTAQEIHDIGLKEVTRIEKDMLKIVEEMGHLGMSVQQFTNLIRNDSNNYYETADELMEGFRDISYKLVPPRLPEIFKNIPKVKLELVAKPSKSAPGAFYYSGSYDGKRPGVFYVNTYDPKHEPKYSMLTLSLHEGNPGHHFQGSHSIENENTASFRRIKEDRNYAYAPSRFPIMSYYSEGWALYAESLGFDMSLYEDPLDRYGHYSDEIFRACRLVVDTGIHTLNWTRQQAVDYMFDHTASTKGNIENEIDRYITIPGQALAYKMGQLKIQELRHAATQKLGDKFDLKDFHEIVLDSVGPLDIVEDEVNKWVEDVMN